MTKLALPAGLVLGLLAAQTVGAQTLSVDQQSLVFTVEVGGQPNAIALTVSSSSSTIVVASTSPGIPWLTVSGGGLTPAALTVSVNPAGLAAGTYSGSVNISTFTGSATLNVPVTMTVSNIIANPSSLSFLTTVGQTPGASSLTLTSVQQVSFNTTVVTSTGGNWLAVSPPFGIITAFQALSAIPNSSIVPTLSAGTYTATITVTPTSGSSNTPLVIPVTLTVAPAPAVTVSPSTINLAYQIGGTNNTTQQTLTLSTNSSAGVQFSIGATSDPNPANQVWVRPDPVGGTITTSGTPVTIAYNVAANLPTGTYSSTVTVITPSGSPTSTNVPVILLVSSQPLLDVPTGTLNFSYELGAASPAVQTVNITTTSSSAQSFTVSTATTTGTGASWLVAPSTGSTGSPLSISVNPVGLVPGKYTGTVTVTGVGTGNGASQIPVVLTVANDPSIVSTSPSLALVYELGQTKTVSQAIALNSSNGVPLSFTATAASSTCGGNWLTLSNATGSTPAQLTVGINSAGLTSGICSGAISVAALNTTTGKAALASPLSIPVTLTVSGISCWW